MGGVLRVRLVGVSMQDKKQKAQRGLGFIALL